MQRWHLTAALTGTALLAAMVAPRLGALTALSTPAPLPQPHAPPPPITPAEAPQARSDTPSGHLLVEASLDQGAILLGQPSERFLAITLTAPEAAGEWVRRPVDLAVVLDASGSMSARGKFDYAKRAAKLLVGLMEPTDTYTLITFEDDATAVVPATRVHDPAVIQRAIDGIYEGGGTNLYAGLDRATKELENTRNEGAVRRMVVLSDGHANVGITDPTALTGYAARLAASGITVSTVGLGLDYNEDLLAQMSDLGGGSYDFVDDPRELEGVFRDELERSAAVIARNTAVHVDLPSHVELLEVIGWDTTRTDDGWTLWMGDLYAGETRKIIARVRVSGDVEGEIHVASVRADYQDLIEGLQASSHAEAPAHVTRDAHLVAASVDREAAVAAHRAWGNWYLDMSTRAYAEGDLPSSKRLIEEGKRVLESASRKLNAPALARDADELQRQSNIYDSYEPSSAEGQRAIKGGKEMFRGRAR